jgi:hypothetical protein
MDIGHGHNIMWDVGLYDMLTFWKHGLTNIGEVQSSRTSWVWEIFLRDILQQVVSSHTEKFHFVTIKHVVFFFKFKFSFQQSVFIFKIIKHWLLFHNPMLQFESLGLNPTNFHLIQLSPLPLHWKQSPKKFTISLTFSD